MGIAGSISQESKTIRIENGTVMHIRQFFNYFNCINPEWIAWLLPGHARLPTLRVTSARYSLTLRLGATHFVRTHYKYYSSTLSKSLPINSFEILLSCINPKSVSKEPNINRKRSYSIWLCHKYLEKNLCPSCLDLIIAAYKINFSQV